MEEILFEETEETYVQESETFLFEEETQEETEEVLFEPSTEDASIPVLQGDVLSATPYASYDGSFSSTYVEYFRGFVSKLSPSVHYLCYRNGQYSYILYYSESLEKNGLRISGNADYYQLDIRNGYALSSGTGSVDENVAFGMYYSDFEGCSSLMGGDYYVSFSLLYAVCVLFLFLLLSALYKLPRRFRRK